MALTYGPHNFYRTSSKYLDLDLGLHLEAVLGFDYCVPNKAFFKAKKLTTHFYKARLSSRALVEFSCLTNFHHVSGDMEMTCLPNGTWVGQEPKCEVDFLKDKLSLSLIIITVSFLLPMLWLGADFYFWIKKRTKIRKVSMMPWSDVRKLGKFDGRENRRPHRVMYPCDGTSVDRLRESMLLNPDVEEYFQNYTSSRNLLTAKRAGTVHKLDSHHQKYLLNLYGTLGRAVFKEFLKTKPPRDNHSDVTGEVTNVDGAVVTKDRKVSMN
ncbi:hypothetical protein RRG08_055300 [Elysia crispata]|uniref:Sushi domain-containing protein n=1 Tax=Elysia crispata TaxID=231223 RepID=A0AAE1AQK7_9GAST|nr:hypothetical protein RRG08_055300 [Elysia crispata]